MAALVLLAGAAGARVVSADLVARLDGLLRGTARRGGGFDALRLAGGLGHLDVEEVADGVPLDGVDHLREHVVALALELGERVALAHGAQTDAGPQVVHLGEVLPPLVVDDGEDDGLLDLTHQVGPELDRKSTRLNSSHVKISYA